MWALGWCQRGGAVSDIHDDLLVAIPWSDVLWPTSDALWPSYKKILTTLDSDYFLQWVEGLYTPKLNIFPAQDKLVTNWWDNRWVKVRHRWVKICQSTVARKNFEKKLEVAKKRKKGAKSRLVDGTLCYCMVILSESGELEGVWLL